MPFSIIVEQDYKNLVDEEMSHITFESKEDFDLFCQSARSLVDSTAVASVAPKYADAYSVLQELINGFELYATEKIIDLTTRTYENSDEESDYIDIAAFRSPQEEKEEKGNAVSRENKIADAQKEYKRIMIERISEKISQFANMNDIKREQYIVDQTQRRQQAKQSHTRMREQKEPREEARTISYESLIERFQFDEIIRYLQEQDLPLNSLSTRQQQARSSPLQAHSAFRPPPNIHTSATEIMRTNAENAHTRTIIITLQQNPRYLGEFLHNSDLVSRTALWAMLQLACQNLSQSEAIFQQIITPDYFNVHVTNIEHLQKLVDTFANHREDIYNQMKATGLNRFVDPEFSDLQLRKLRALFPNHTNDMTISTRPSAGHV